MKRLLQITVLVGLVAVAWPCVSFSKSTAASANRSSVYAQARESIFYLGFWNRSVRFWAITPALIQLKATGAFATGTGSDPGSTGQPPREDPNPGEGESGFVDR